MATKREQIEVVVTSVSSKGNLITLGCASGAIEVVRGGAPADLTKVQVNTAVIVEVTSANKKKFEAGNTVSGTFVSIKVEPAPAAPRGSDSKNS